jgi:hypothetical protein
MAWGGTLNKEGSDHIRELKEADKVVKFLEKFKGRLDKQKKEKFNAVIGIIVNYYTRDDHSQL